MFRKKLMLYAKTTTRCDQHNLLRLLSSKYDEQNVVVMPRPLEFYGMKLHLHFVTVVLERKRFKAVYTPLRL